MEQMDAIISICISSFSFETLHTGAGKFLFDDLLMCNKYRKHNEKKNIWHEEQKNKPQFLQWGMFFFFF